MDQNRLRTPGLVQCVAFFVVEDVALVIYDLFIHGLAYSRSSKMHLLIFIPSLIYIFERNLS